MCLKAFKGCGFESHQGWTIFWLFFALLSVPLVFLPYHADKEDNVKRERGTTCFYLVFFCIFCAPVLFSKTFVVMCLFWATTPYHGGFPLVQFCWAHNSCWHTLKTTSLQILPVGPRWIVGSCAQCNPLVSIFRSLNHLPLVANVNYSWSTRNIYPECRQCEPSLPQKRNLTRQCTLSIFLVAVRVPAPVCYDAAIHDAHEA